MKNIALAILSVGMMALAVYSQDVAGRGVDAFFISGMGAVAFLGVFWL